MKAVTKVVAALLSNVARSATLYISPKMTVVATRRGKPDRREKAINIVLSIGTPNYQSRKFIKACIAAGEPFPVKKVQLKFWPEKKAKKK